MDDLPKTAILLIYPDGEIEKCMITNHRFHIDYLKELLRKSPRFAKICRKCNYTSGIHISHDEALALNGVIAMYNFNIRDIVDDLSLLYEDLPSFEVFLPRSFGSMEQLDLINYFYENYPQRKMGFYKLKEKYELTGMMNFDDVSYEDFGSYVREEKEKLEKQKVLNKGGSYG